MVSIKPKDLAETIKEDPETFISAIKEAGEMHQKQAAEKALEKQFKNPANIPTEGRVTFGNPSAPVTIVEYSDFQCPYCQRAAKSMRRLKDKYKGKVKLVYKHLPLSFHPFARPAADYFEAVAIVNHEKARKFHDEIFDNFSDYAKLQKSAEINKSLDSIVKKIGVDLKDVKKNLSKAKKVVEKDIEESKKLGVGGTPTFFINGINARGRVEAVIERLLQDEES